jgi:hypothetical protein
MFMKEKIFCFAEELSSKVDRAMSPFCKSVASLEKWSHSQ